MSIRHVLGNGIPFPVGDVSIFKKLLKKLGFSSGRSCGWNSIDFYARRRVECGDRGQWSGGRWFGGGESVWENVDGFCEIRVIRNCYWWKKSKPFRTPAQSWYPTVTNEMAYLEISPLPTMKMPYRPTDRVIWNQVRDVELIYKKRYPRCFEKVSWKYGLRLNCL